MGTAPVSGPSRGSTGTHLGPATGRLCDLSRSLLLTHLCPSCHPFLSLLPTRSLPRFLLTICSFSPSRLPLSSKLCSVSRMVLRLDAGGGRKGGRVRQDLEGSQ